MGQSSRTPDCLNTIRLVAALQVLYVHSVAHLSLDMPPIVTNVLGFFKGVPIFFTLSGFLIWFSIGRSSSFLDYARKRFWRILRGRAGNTPGSSASSCVTGTPWPCP